MGTCKKTTVKLNVFECGTKADTYLWWKLLNRRLQEFISLSTFSLVIASYVSGFSNLHSHHIGIFKTVDCNNNNKLVRHLQCYSCSLARINRDTNFLKKYGTHFVVHEVWMSSLFLVRPFVIVPCFWGTKWGIFGNPKANWHKHVYLHKIVDNLKSSRYILCHKRKLNKFSKSTLFDYCSGALWINISVIS